MTYKLEATDEEKQAPLINYIKKLEQEIRELKTITGNYKLKTHNGNLETIELHGKTLVKLINYEDRDEIILKILELFQVDDDKLTFELENIIEPYTTSMWKNYN